MNFVLPAEEVTRLLVGHLRPCLQPGGVSFVQPTEEVTRLLVGHFRPCLPPPAGGGALLSPGTVRVQHCHMTELRTLLYAKIEEKNLRDRHVVKPYEMVSCSRELRPKLMLREIDPETGKVTAERVWNNRDLDTLSKDEMRVRGARKQISARVARKLESIDSAVLEELASDVKGMFAKRHDITAPSPAKQFQGFRTTNFKTGEKYSGSMKDIREAQRKLAIERGEIEPDPPKKVHVASEGAPADSDTLNALIESAKEMFGLK